ncbi:MAG TPA: FAD-binding oxidoreductase [Gemmatimonadaceae bacterium]|jgi:FAD/FMN-containing dehydrogenase|nr:FAD-binding oxidoreductase [Gemmatimonadaceae bacterium]
MPVPQVRTLDDSEITLASTDIESLAASLRGPLVTPGTPGYDEARTVWNAMHDRHPALVARCASAADVVHAVRFARDKRLLVAVRGGGHNVGGLAVADGAFLIDLSLMRGVRVDPSSRTATVEPGCTLADVDHDAQAFGLALPVGVNSTTGIAGLTLGGGFGWLSRKFGLTIDNLNAVDIVTANGELIRADRTHHADLFWAIRGGGGNFGIVTSFEFRLHVFGPTILAGLVVHPIADARDVLRYYAKFTSTADDSTVCWFVLRKAPPLPFLSPEYHGKEILALAMAHLGEQAEGEEALQPIRRFGHPIADVVGPMPYTAWQQILDPLLAPGMRNYWKSNDFTALSDGLIDVFLDFAARIPDPQTEIAFAQLGGAIEEVPWNATAYTHRDAQYTVNLHTRWADPSNDAACIQWARDLFNATAPFATGGVYVNFLTADETERVHQAYGSNYGRLLELKRQYDPSNLFRVNNNIRPGIPSLPMGTASVDVRIA